MSSKELLKIINSLTDEERRLALQKVEKKFNNVMNALKKTDYFDTDDLNNFKENTKFEKKERN